ncbi:hypothetical protein PROFUN_00221 [Planoprotostelium fungivorum]|uniref:DDE Tnp4 domain-containing protein n=1 Tax=Planoprotostelium fungivorum TaxID=1890364 RepID=A0A2P6NXR4_9EUKA|nr:hypothetical protein PROFUN_00221 [Planoprotostelium fungivorum]
MSDKSYTPWISFKDARKFIREQFGPIASLAKANMVVCLYHDLKGHGWSHIEREIDLGFRLGHNSMNHNSSKMKTAAFFWGKLHITVGDSEEWNRNTISAWRARWLCKINLFMDSVYFSLSKSSARQEYNDCHHSFKENHPGLRFMCLSDGKGCASCAEQSTLVQLLQGGHITTDAHFAIGKELFCNPKFYVTGGKHRDPDTSDNDEALLSTTKVQEKRNHQLTALCSRVERPFAQIKKKWAVLRHPYRGPSRGLTHTVFIAMAANNIQKVGGLLALQQMYRNWLNWTIEKNAKKFLSLCQAL